MKVLQELSILLGVETKKGDVEKAEKGMSNLKTAAIAAAAAFAAIKAGAFFKEMANQGEELQRQATALGLTNTELLGLQTSADVAGLGVAGINKAVGDLQERLGDAQTMGGTLGQVFKDMGVDVNNAGDTAAEKFLNVGEAISKIDDDTQRVNLARKVFGRKAVNIIDMFSAGAQGVRQDIEDLAAASGGSIDDFGKQATEFNAMWARIKGQMNALAILVFTKVAPVIVGALRKLNDFIKPVIVSIGDLLKGSMALETAMAIGLAVLTVAIVKFGTMAAIAGAKALLPWLPLIAAAGVFFLIMEDIASFVSGGDSVLGNIVSYLFGEQALQDMQGFWSDAGNEFTAFFADFSENMKIFATQWAMVLLDLIRPITNKFKAFGAWASNLFNTVSSTIGAMGDAIKQVLDNIFGFFDSIPEKADSAIASLVSKMKSIPGFDLIAKTVLGSGGSGSTNNTNSATQNNTININGGDARAIGQQVSGRLKGDMKQAVAKTRRG